MGRAEKKIHILLACTVLCILAFCYSGLLYSQDASSIETNRSDSTETIVISKAIYAELNRAMANHPSPPSFFNEIEIGDTISFHTFLNLLGSKQYDEEANRDIQLYETSKKVEVSPAILSIINTRLTKEYEPFDFYPILKNVEVLDTIPFRYIEYLWDLSLYWKDRELRLARETEKKLAEGEAQAIPEREAPSETVNSARSEPYKPSLPVGAVSAKDTVFRVQIAASPIPLSLGKLQKIYPGRKTIILNKTGNWYRYSIGHCPSYSHATYLKNSIPVKGAFEVAYQGDQRLNAFEIRNQYDKCAPLALTNSLPSSSETVYRVQVAASQDPLTEKRLQEIYCGQEQVTMVYEEEWFKYLVGHYATFEDAAQVVKLNCVPDAFVVVYKNGKRLDIMKHMLSD